MHDHSTAAVTGGVPAAVPLEGRLNYLDEYRFELVQRPLPDGVLAEEARIPMRDGVHLAASVFRPAAGGAVPVIATATPYGKDRYDQWHTFGPGGSVPGGAFHLGHVEVSDHTAFEAPDPGHWVPLGYAVVLVDLPGRGRSESNPQGGPGIEARWADVCAWLEEQDWCTGAVAMSGVSALCAVQWAVAKDPAPPQLKAIIAWEGFNETGPGGGYGGIPETAFPAWLMTEWLTPSANPDAAGPEAELFGWAYDSAAIRVPALVCASFSDQELHSWDTFDAFTRLGSEHKWLFGHRRQKWGAYYGADELALQKRFLDRFLKGDHDAMEGVPPVRLEINESRDEYKVIAADAWPLEQTRYRALHLDAGSGRLVDEPVSTTATSSYDAAAVGDNDSRAAFDYVFDRDTDVVGHMALTLFVEVQGASDVDLFVGVEKLDADGNEVYFYSASGGNPNGPVSRGWLRASKRRVDDERSTPWRPVLTLADEQPLGAGEIVEVTIPVMPSGTTFRAGETLRLVVQSWSLPGQWEGGEAREWDVIGAGRYLLHTGGGHPSRLLLPVL